MGSGRPTPLAAAAALCLAAGLLALAPGIGRAQGRTGESDRRDRRVQVGDKVDDAELRTADGRRDHLLAKGAKANVFVFFRPEHDRSLDTLKDLARCEKDFSGKPVRFVGVVSDAWPLDEVNAFVREAGVSMPVLVDEGDLLYGRLGIRLHPVIGIVDGQRKLVAFEPFRQINYCDRVRVRIRWALGEATEADVAKVDQPERTVTHSEAGVARRHLNFARELHRIRQDEKALEEAKRSLAFVPSAEGYALQGEILASLRRCPDALRAFEAALALEPANAAARDGKRGCGP
jgi:tetratricopeptide (TPR) repeat protein